MIELERRTFLQAGLAAGALSATPALAATSAATPPSPRRTTVLHDDWRFHLGHASDMARDFGFGRNQRTFAKAGAQTADVAMAVFDDTGWQSVRVPHDWAVDLPYARPAAPAPKDSEDAVAAHGFKAIGRDHPENSVGWYRRTIAVAHGDRERATWLEFDGVFRDCIVFVNGYVVGGTASGYVPFRVDIGDFLDYDGGPNVVALRVDASLGEGWFYEGAGLYRSVTLVSAAAMHIPQWGVVVRAEPTADSARVIIVTDVANSGMASPAATLHQSVLAPDGRVVATSPTSTLHLALNTQSAVEFTTIIPRPSLWTLESPQLYRVVSEIRIDGSVVDRVETPFGIRAIAFDAERGFFLNGKPTKLLGSCNHQDHAGVGTAIPDALHAWRVAQLKGMGSNAWRSAHNPPAQALLDICDGAGMLMIVEARLNSTSPEAVDELDRMVRSSRNHPSVILWSVGNEEPQQGTPRGARISAEMIAQIRALDPTRPTTQAFDSGFGQGASNVIDVIGFNYRTDQIPAFHAAHPTRPIIGTETASAVSTRGEYVTDPARHTLRAYDTEHPWWATTAEEWWKIAAAHPYIAGGFIWTGFDYRGEPTPYAQWPSVSSSFGVFDLCGFPKDSYWYYRAWWCPEQPLVHLLPHWNWPGREGQPIEVWAHGNCDEVELLVNGVSAGRRVMPRNGHLAWTVPYAPGRIEAHGYTRGARVVSDTRETSAAPAAIRLTADRRQLAADGRDVAMVRAEIVDHAGRTVPTAAVPVTFAISGAGRLIGVGNGDPTSTEADKGPRRTSFNGLCQAIVQTDTARGGIRVTATAPGLTSASVAILTH